ncbi:MAG: hypothetical protein AAGL97_09810 [Pseudomonadota bacterium]
MSENTSGRSLLKKLSAWRWRQSNRLRHRLFRLSPRFFTPKRYRESLERDRAKDAAENEKYKVSEDQFYRVYALLSVEYFAPSHMDDLIRSIEQAGWDPLSVRGESTSDWIRQSRMTLEGGNWLNFGELVRPSERHRFLGEPSTAEMPDWCDYINLQLSQLTPSLTACTAVFYLKPEQRLDLVEIANKKHVSNIDPAPKGGYSFNAPVFLKDDEIGARRRGWAEDARAWFKAHLPGLFSSRTSHLQAPITEIGMIDTLEPFAPKESPDNRHQTLDTFKLYDYWEAWRSVDISSLKFSQRVRHLRVDLSDYSVAAMSRNDKTALENAGVTDASPELVRMMRSTIALLGVHQVLRNYTRVLSEARDTLSASRRTSSPLRQANSLKARHVSLADIEMVLGELSDEGLGRFAQCETAKFEHQEVVDGKSLDLTEEIEKRLMQDATRLARLNRSVNQMISERQSIVTSTAMLRLAQLTILLAILAIVTTNWEALFETANQLRNLL